MARFGSVGGPLGVEYVALCCVCGCRARDTVFKTCSNTSGGGKVEGSGSGRDGCVQKKLCSTGTCRTCDEMFGSFLPFELTSSLEGGSEPLGDGAESTSCGRVEDVDARRVTRVRLAKFAGKSFLG